MAFREPVVKQGPLSYKNKKQFLKRARPHHVMLYGNSGLGVARMEMYDNEKNINSGAYTILIVGSEVLTVRKHIVNLPETGNATFMIDTKDKQQYTFTAKDGKDCDDWVSALQNTLFTTSIPRQINSTNSFTEDNEIYQTAEEVGRGFTVTMTLETRQKLAADNPVRLVVENGNITVISMDGNRIVRWSIVHLRRIGHSDDDFHVETGRKSEKGPGDFVFQTKMGKNIHNLVNKEKDLCRQNNNVVPPGQVNTPILPDAASLPMGSHIYEEVVPAFRQQTPVTRPNSSTQPARSTSQELLPFPSNGTATPPRSPGHWQGIKSHSTLPYSHAKSRPTTETMRPIGAARIEPQPQTDGIYTEPGVPPEPWRTHGIGDDDFHYANAPPVANDANDKMYDNLMHLTPVAKRSEEDPYACPSIPKPNADAAYLEASREMQEANHPPQQQQQEKQSVANEAIYAEVDRTKKTKRKNKK